MGSQLYMRLTDATFTDGQVEYLSVVSRYASRGVVLDSQNRVAMLHVGSSGYCKLPGGGIENGETKEQAFIREVREETGYDCQIFKELGLIEEHKNKNGFLQHSYCFMARISGERHAVQLTKNEQQLALELVWMDMEEAITSMNISLQSCREYGKRFMLLRDKTIFEHASQLFTSS